VSGPLRVQLSATSEVLLVTLSVMALPFVVGARPRGERGVKRRAPRPARPPTCASCHATWTACSRTANLVHRSGRGLKRFDVRDGQGLVLLARPAVVTAVVTRRRSEIPERRPASSASSRSTRRGRQGGHRALGILARHGVRAADACYVGDDVGDLPAMALVASPSRRATPPVAVRKPPCTSPTPPRRAGAVRSSATSSSRPHVALVPPPLTASPLDHVSSRLDESAGLSPCVHLPIDPTTATKRVRRAAGLLDHANRQ